MIRDRIARRIIQNAYDALGRGDATPALAAFTQQGRFRFAGTHNWTVDTSDAAIRRSWFRRFAAMRPQLVARDVLVAGPPWAMRMCVVFDDAIRDDTGNLMYSNHGVQYVQMRWSHITLDEINLDTQLVEAFDRSSHQPGGRDTTRNGKRERDATGSIAVQDNI